MELFKHTVIYAFKNILKVFRISNRGFLSIIVMLFGSVVIIPLFIFSFIFYVFYYFLNYLYSFVSGITKKIYIKSNSVLLALPFLLIGIAIFILSIVMYFLTKWISKLLVASIRFFDYQKHLEFEELVFFINSPRVVFQGFYSR